MVEGKSENHIDCLAYNEKQAQLKVGGQQDNNSSGGMITFDINPLEPQVCKAETSSQILETKLNKYLSPVQSFFPIILILFAGGWSDKRGRRKICMLIPMLGELGSNIGKNRLHREQEFN